MEGRRLLESDGTSQTDDGVTGKEVRLGKKNCVQFDVPNRLAVPPRISFA